MCTWRNVEGRALLFTGGMAWFSSPKDLSILGKKPNLRIKSAGFSHQPWRGGIWEEKVGFAVFSSWESWAQVSLRRVCGPDAILPDKTTPMALMFSPVLELELPQGTPPALGRHCRSLQDCSDRAQELKILQSCSPVPTVWPPGHRGKGRTALGGSVLFLMMLWSHDSKV